MPEKQSSSRRQQLEHIQLPMTSSSAGQPAAPQTQQQVTSLKTEQHTHAGLWLNKYIASLKRGDTASHAQLVDEVAQLDIPPIYHSFYKRWEHTLKNEYHADPREFKVKGRMAVGLGSEGVLETSVMLHRTYGVPYIPGSALKGLAASYARLMAGKGWESGSPAYKTVFGEANGAGYITFFDALYVPNSARNNHPLCPDIITVHHAEYYKGDGQPPADWESPIPVPFLSAVGHYLIVLAAPELDNGQAWIDRVFEILQEALLVMGIGAKTSSGYGRMKLDSTSDKTTDLSNPESE